MAIYSSEDILNADDLYDIQEMVCCFGQSIQYRLTADEIKWIDFVRGRYSIADYLDENMVEDILTISDADEMSQALNDDCNGFGKAVCLSDETALQKLFFWLYQ